MPECAKTHLQQSRISKFSREDPRPPPSSRGEKGGERERKEGGEGWGGKEGGMGEGRGTRYALRPPRDKLWIRPLKKLWTNFSEISGGVRCMTSRPYTSG